MKRPRLKTKLTKNNRIVGRPYGNADTLVSDMPKDPTAGRYDATLWIIHAVTGRGVEGFAEKRTAELRSEGVEIDKESVRRQLRKTRSRLSTK